MDHKDIGVMFGLLKADLVQMETNLLQELDQIKARLGNIELTMRGPVEGPSARTLFELQQQIEEEKKNDRSK